MRYLLSALVVICFLSCCSALPEGKALHYISQLQMQEYEPYVEPRQVKMACPTLPAPAPTNDITQLKPGHIKYMMSMGDSITAAMSAKDTNVLSLKEYRGISFPIGGDANVTTMANLLGHYAPSVIGRSTGTGLRTSTGTGFNAAVSGALNVDMLGQAQWLVETMKNAKVNMSEWKVLTMWIGSNNLCAVCKNKAANDADDYEKRITEALEYIQANIPKVFVNLLCNLDTSKLRNFTSGACGSLHLYECSCASTNPAQITSATKEYHARTYKIANAFNARRDPGFAVIAQPFLIDSVILDRTYLSAADCFHPSAICHTELAVALWNNMITPQAQKKHAFTPGEQPLCATDSTLLYTY